MKKAIMLSIPMLFAASAPAQQILTRANLNSLLTSSTSDGFETFNIPVSNAATTDVTSMDSTTVVLGQGPGLVNPGATYLSTDGKPIQWNGDQYFGINTQSILINGDNGQFEIDYSAATQAMGLDARCFSGFGYSGTMDVYNGATLVGTMNFSLPGNAGDTTFLGWQNSGGITKVVISSGAFPWSPIIDDHTYGTINTVPEPASMAAIGLGLVALIRKRRK